jgi:sugar diacid utilization regulator
MELAAADLLAGSRVYLDLLDSGAAAADFDLPLARGRAAGLPEPVLAELEQARQTALRIRDELAQRRRRETELAALFETAGDLAALHDLDAVLRAIVRRARLLLGTDVAYVTLNDSARGDTYVRVTSGSTSPAFQRLRLALGEGLGGLVAERAEPYTSADYLTDPRFRHTAAIDGGVTEEGLIGILGVPLLLGGSVIGVLFAADRRVRVFGPAEISLLSSLAAHAAVAIDGARLLDETRTAVAELNAANQLIQQHSEAVERTSQAHRLFTELVLGGGTAQDVAGAVAEVLSRPVVILGDDDAPIAASAHPGDRAGSTLSAAAATTGAATAAEAARGSHRAVCSGALWAVAATAGSQHLGTLILAAGPDLPDTDRLILERAAMVTALLLLLRRSVTETEHRIRGELLSDLLAAPLRDAGSLRDRAQRLGADLDQPHVVVVASCGPAERSRVRPAAAHLAATRRGLAAEHEGAVVLLLPGTDAAAVAREIGAALGAAAGRPVTTGSAVTSLGAGPVGGGLAVIAAGYRDARRCAEALDALGRGGESAAICELGFLGLLLADSKDVPGFLTAAIGPVLSYDERKGTRLLRTLEAYFEARGNLSRTSSLLHLHVNTVTQRLDRVTRLLGDGWQDGDRALEIRVAIRLFRAGATAGGAG